MNKIVTFSLILLGIIFLVVGYVYLTTSANNLPSYFPGFDTSITKIHFKHGIGSIILGLGSFILAWFQMNKKTVAPTSEQ